MDPVIYNHYFSTLALFLIVLAGGERLFTKGYARKDRFYLRFLGGNLLAIVLCGGLTVVYYAVDLYLIDPILIALKTSAMYLLLFSMSIAVMRFSFKEPLQYCLVAGALSYVCQHISYNVYAIFNLAFSLEQNVRYLFCLGLQLLCAVAVIFLVMKVIYKRIASFAVDKHMHGDLLFITTSSIGIVLIFSIVVFFLPKDDLLVNVFARLLLVVCCIFVLSLYVNFFQLKKVRDEKDIVLLLNQKEHEYFERLSRDIELVNIKCHDIKHLISAAQVREGVDLTELSKAVERYEDTVKTGNEALDAVLSERQRYCKFHDIAFTVKADGSLLRFLSATDLCALFGNMLENAVEAAEQVQESERRAIELQVYEAASQVFVCVKNYYDKELVLKNGAPATSKGDELYHGYGLKSIQMIAEKYGGVFSYKAENGVFRVSILFPSREKAET